MIDGQLDDRLDRIVQDSWQRSKRYQVDPFQPKGKLAGNKVLSEKQLQLIEIASPLMEGLYSIVKGSGFLVILCDGDGILAKVIGDDNVKREGESILFMEGADWSEQAIGTNAIGTCIVEKKPLQIFANEHYAQICHPWTCSASPIFDSDGSVAGVLNMSGSFENVHPHTLGMVMSAVKAIEYQLRLIEKSEVHYFMQKYLEATTNTLTEGLIITDQEGKIIKTNNRLQKMLRLGDSDLQGKTLSEAFLNKTFRHKNRKIQDKEVRLKMPGRNVHAHVLVNITPVYDSEQLIGSLVSMKEIHKVRQFVNHLSGNQAKVSFQEMTGNHPRFIQRITDAKMAARTDSNVLLLGESGTGKDMVAQAIHNESARKDKPFIAINCGGIPRDLLGSELFGYAEGAFTGARKGGSPGKFELADGGTLFLDEIGEMSLEMQVLLLRVLQDKEIVRIGGHKVTPVDVRIIAATNKDLKWEVEKGSFREDLYFRLNVMPVKLPPLRDRIEDIPLLVRHFANKLSIRLGRDIPSIDPGYFEPLFRYSWPGNIRELQNVVERSMNRLRTDILTYDDLPEELKGAGPLAEKSMGLPKKDEIKKMALLESIKVSNGNMSKAARRLGVSRSTLYRQIRRFGLEEKV